MHCPDCQQMIANGSEICQHCDWRLFNIPNTVKEISSAQAFEVQPSSTSPQISTQSRPLLLYGGYINSDSPNDRVVWTIPLTILQRLHLLLRGVIPLMVISIPLFFVKEFTGFRDINLAWILWLLFVVGIGRTSLLILLDLLNGEAEVQITRLQKIRLSTSRNSAGSYFGRFDRIGEIEIGRKNYNAALQGAIYQVTYSPHSKRLWAMHPIS